MKKLTRKRLKKLLHYSKKTGLFTWKVDRGRNKVKWEIAGTTKADYVSIRLYGKRYLAHRLAFLYVKGYLPENDVDHVNRITIDNRWENIRHVSRTCNARNSKINSRNKLGIKGVRYRKETNIFSAQIVINGKQIHLGNFKKLKKAISARKKAEEKYNFYCK